LLTNYKIYNGDTLIDTVDDKILEYSYTSVTGGQSYLISITSYGLIGESDIKSLATLIWAIETPIAPVIAVTGTSRDSCTISWSAVTPPSSSIITGYMILIDDGKSGPFRVAHDGSTLANLFDVTIMGLSSKTTYRLTGYAQNKAGDGTNATEITCYTSTTPGVPGTPVWVSSTASTLEVKWDPAYDDGGSPIKEYQLVIDEVEGLDVANIESWTVAYTGSALTYNINTGLTATLGYRIRVKAITEHLLESSYSNIAIYYAAPLPP
jgi:hypothetical protein